MINENQKIIGKQEFLFENINHFKNYPSLRPWIGKSYSSNRILVVGESHYLEPGCSCHLDSERWYSGESSTDLTTENIKWMNTQRIITNGIKNRWKERSKLIYKNLESALKQTGLFHEIEPYSPFEYIAYLNFFQRPAQTDGDSIKPDRNDITYSRLILNEILLTINPRLVIFCTRLGAKEANLKNIKLENPHIQLHVTAHPASAWWNRPSKKSGGVTSRQSFIEFLKGNTNNKSESLLG